MSTTPETTPAAAAVTADNAPKRRGRPPKLTDPMAVFWHDLRTPAVRFASVEIVSAATVHDHLSAHADFVDANPDSAAAHLRVAGLVEIGEVR